MRILWVHSYDTKVDPASGIFMQRQIEWLRDADIQLETLYLPIRSPIRLARALLRLRRIYTRYSVVHDQTGSLTGFLVARLTSFPIISLRGSDWYRITYGGLFVRLHSLLAVWFTQKALTRVGRVICVSNRMRGEVLDLNPRLRTEVIPSGVDLTKFQPRDRQECRRILGREDDDSIWILFSSVTSNNPIKQRYLALEAYEYAKSVYDDIKFIEITDVHPEDVSTYINGSHVVLLTSIHEGWPNIVKEALACCIPFVSTDVSDLREAAEQLPQCYVVDSHPAALGRAIIDSISVKPSSSLREYAHRFDSALITEQLLRVYEQAEKDGMA